MELGQAADMLLKLGHNFWCICAAVFFPFYAVAGFIAVQPIHFVLIRFVWVMT